MTIAEQLNIKDFPFFINNDMQKEIYREMSNGWWYKREFDDKKREIFQILSMYIQSVKDIMFRFIDFHKNNSKQKTEKGLIEGLYSILNEINPLIEYVNELLDNISKTYQCVTYQISIPEKKYNRNDIILVNINKKKGYDEK